MPLEHLLTFTIKNPFVFIYSINHEENKERYFTFTDLLTSSSLFSSSSPVSMPLRSTEAWRGEAVIWKSVFFLVSGIKCSFLECMNLHKNKKLSG